MRSHALCSFPFHSLNVVLFPPHISFWQHLTSLLCGLLFILLHSLVFKSSLFISSSSLPLLLHHLQSLSALVIPLVTLLFFYTFFPDFPSVLLFHSVACAVSFPIDSSCSSPFSGSLHTLSGFFFFSIELFFF